jgi:CubicO group peptidase (beta-lactamase class C family)
VTPWPTLAWATGPQQTGDPDRVEQLLDRAFRTNPNSDLALTLAIVVVQGGRIVAERYSPGTTAFTPLISWSTAKSITHAAVGIAIRDGLMALHEPLRVPEWSEPNDPRREITLDHLLAMRSGLRFSEDYVNDGSDCLEMLFGRGADDVAHYAASLPLEHPPDTVWNYSSGTTNIICRALGDAVGGSRQATEDFLRRELFGPLGMTSASPRFDDAGTWIGSSYVFATARDFARFGMLYLHEGRWEQRLILPEGWVTHARTPRSEDGEGGFYGHHWWVWGDDLGTFAAHGYEGQRIIVVPPLDLVVVRLGKTPAEHKAQLQSFLVDLVDAFRPT